MAAIWEIAAHSAYDMFFKYKKVQAGKDQEKVQSEKYSHSKNRCGKKTNQQSGTDTKKTFRKPNEQLFSEKVATQLP